MSEQQPMTRPSLTDRQRDDVDRMFRAIRRIKRQLRKRQDRPG